MRFAWILVICGLVAGCGGRPIGVLTPVAAAYPSASQVDILVATTRQSVADTGVLFSGERSRDLSLAAVKVSIPPDEGRQIGQVQWPSRLPPDPSREFATLAVTPIDGKKAARTWLNGHLPPKRRVLLFVHGFNNRFEDAVYRFAQIVHDSGADVAPVLFTWPSRARIFDYLYDRESTNFSRDALEETLRTIANDPRVSEVTVMAHSMGAWLAVEALRQMSIRDGRVAPRIRNVILASPDLDVDVFATQWASLGQPRPDTFLFTSRRDRALALSRRLSGNVSRLGMIDPNDAAYREQLKKAGIVVFDLTDVESSGDRLNHGTFAGNPEVVQLIGARLITGQTITDSDASLGERIGTATMGLGQAVGGAAGLALSAPIAVFDPNSRRTYGDQIQQLGRTIETNAEAVAP